MSYDALVKAATSDLSTTSHIDLEDIKRKGFIDVLIPEQGSKYVRTLLTYWGAIRLSQGKWGDIDEVEKFRRVSAIISVIADSAAGIDALRQGMVQAMSYSDSERLAQLPHLSFSQIAVWAHALAPMLIRMANQLYGLLRCIRKYDSREPSLWQYVLNTDPPDVWNLDNPPTPVSAIVPIITDLEEPYREERICPASRLPLSMDG